MPEYRTPEEDREQDEQVARVRAAFADTVRDAAFLKAAMVLAEDQDVVELWVDRVWDNLRAALSDEDRLAAILLLLDDQINAEFCVVMHGMREAP
jgi:hypothetical protein